MPERGGSGERHREHVRAVERLGQDARRHVRDAGDCQAAQPHVARSEHLGHRGHPDEIAAKRPHVCDKGCDHALEYALITAPEARDPQLLAKLDAVAGRVLNKPVAAH